APGGAAEPPPQRGRRARAAARHERGPRLVEGGRTPAEAARRAAGGGSGSLVIEARQQPRALLGWKGGLQRLQEHGAVAPVADAPQEVAHPTDALVVQRRAEEEERHVRAAVDPLAEVAEDQVRCAAGA